MTTMVASICCCCKTSGACETGGDVLGPGWSVLPTWGTAGCSGTFEIEASPRCQGQLLTGGTIITGAWSKNVSWTGTATNGQPLTLTGTVGNNIFPSGTLNETTLQEATGIASAGDGYGLLDGYDSTGGHWHANFQNQAWSADVSGHIPRTDGPTGPPYIPNVPLTGTLGDAAWSTPAIFMDGGLGTCGPATCSPLGGTVSDVVAAFDPMEAGRMSGQCRFVQYVAEESDLTLTLSATSAEQPILILPGSGWGVTMSGQIFFDKLFGAPGGDEADTLDIVATVNEDECCTSTNPNATQTYHLMPGCYLFELYAICNDLGDTAATAIDFTIELTPTGP